MMMMGVVLVLCLGLLVVVLWKQPDLVHRVVARVSSMRTGPRVLPPIPEAMRAVSPEHCALAETHAREFEAHFQKTFEWRSADRTAATHLVRGLFARRAAMLAELDDVRMRAPNNSALERSMTPTREDASRRTMEHIEDARERCGVPLLHPVPLEDWQYSRWYRAANDVTH